MQKGTLDFSPLERLGLELPAVGVKFDFFRPEGIPPLEQDRPMALCEMLRECQRRRAPFYFSREHQETCTGKVWLGMETMAAVDRSGQIGPRLGVFQDFRANGKLYRTVPKMEPGTVNYVSFSPVDQLAFDPDVLVAACDEHQAEILLRSYAWSTGELYISKSSPVMGCTWFLIYPYVSGEINYVLPNLVHGPHGRQLYPQGTVLVSIPYSKLPVVLRNLALMETELKGHESREAYFAEFGGILSDLAREAQDP